MRPDKKKKNYSKGKVHGRDTVKPDHPTVPPQPARFSTEIAAGPEEEDAVQIPPKDVVKSVKVVTTTSEKPPKNISTNWTRFEIPSDDENGDESNMSGMDFKLALENAGGSSAQLVLKSEAAWDQLSNDLNSDFFSLNIKVIQDAMECIPLQLRIGLLPEESDSSTLIRLSEQAAVHREQFFCQKKKDVVTLSEKLLTSLKTEDEVKKETSDSFEDDIDKLLETETLDNSISDESPLSKQTLPPPHVDETKELEDWLDDFLE